MTQHFSTLLAAAVAQPHTAISALPLMDPAEQQLVLQTFNATDAQISTATVHGLFEATAAAHPARCCLIGGDARMTYAQVGQDIVISEDKQLPQHLEAAHSCNIAANGRLGSHFPPHATGQRASQSAGAPPKCSGCVCGHASRCHDGQGATISMPDSFRSEQCAENTSLDQTIESARPVTAISHTLQHRERGSRDTDALVHSSWQCAELYLGLLAVMKAGGCYVPIDHTLPAARVQSNLEQSGCSLMLAQRGVEALSALQSVSIVYLSADWQQFASQPRSNPADRCRIADPAYILFTSGKQSQFF